MQGIFTPFSSGSNCSYTQFVTQIHINEQQAKSWTKKLNTVARRCGKTNLYDN